MRDERHVGRHDERRYKEAHTPRTSQDGIRREKSLGAEQRAPDGHDEQHHRHSWNIFDRLKKHHNH